MLDHLLVRISSGSDQSKPLPQSTQVSPARGGVRGEVMMGLINFAVGSLRSW